MEISLALFDGFFDHVDRHFERSRQRADEADTSLEVACAELFKPAQALGYVLIPAATHQRTVVG
jgi:hypothetical protein